MMSFSETESFLKAVAEESRLEILSYLILDSFCVCELVELLHMSQPSISQHLKRLRDSGLVLEEKRGKWTFHSLNRRHKLYPLLLHLVSVLPSVDGKLHTFTEENGRIQCN